MGQLIAFPTARIARRQRVSASLLEPWRQPSPVARRQALVLWLSAALAVFVLAALQVLVVPR